MAKAYLGVITTLIIMTTGCADMSVESGGSEFAARSFIKDEFSKWMAGDSNKTQTLEFATYEPPVGFEILSLVASDPNAPEASIMAETSDDKQKVKYYKANVKATFRSKAGSPMDKVIRYNLLWSPSLKQWKINQRLDG